MNKTARKQAKRYYRNARGNAIVESGAATFLLSAVAVPFIIFLANLASQIILQSEIAHIANQAALVSDDGKYWLGAPRPGYDQSVATAKAQHVADELCKRVGLTGASVNVTFDSSNPEFDVTVCDINVNAVGKIPFRTNVFGFDMAQLFPGNAHARGVAAHAKVQPYALIRMDAPTVEDQVATRPLGLNRRDVAVIPAYGFFNNMVAGSPNESATPYGKGVADLNPENYFAMNHYHLKKSDVDYVNATGNEVALSGWHPGRVINGQKVTFR